MVRRLPFVKGSSWPVVACCDRQQWLFSASMPVKSNANDWSGRMQVGGQVCAITQTKSWQPQFERIRSSSGGWEK